MKKKKKTIGAIFMQRFIVSFVWITVLCAIGFVSNRISYWYYSSVEKPKASESLSKYIKDLQSDGVAEEVGKNLILAEDEETGSIKRIVIEIVNKRTGNIDYITVPNGLEFTMSYELYKKLATANPDIPQIICMRKVSKYFQDENKYQCAQLLLEDVMDISFSYYTVIPYAVYKDMFRTDKKSGVQKWRKSYKEEMVALHSQEAYQEFFEKYYEKVSSNLREEDKLTYIDAYLQGVPSQVAFTIVSGESSDKVFYMSVEETNSLLHQIVQNTAYTVDNQPQEEGEISSMGLAIKILNSTKINGLASSYQEKLIQDGMNVLSIGNYSGETLGQTKLIVKKEGYGTDLLPYFNNAVLEVAQEGTQDVDICIILGTNDREMQ